MTTVTTISTHVLDTALGKPAANITVWLEKVNVSNESLPLSQGVTNADGRVVLMAPEQGGVEGGRYRLRFDVGAYFAESQREAFYDEISLDFRVASSPQHYHVPLLLSPFGYATYRGS